MGLGHGKYKHFEAYPKPSAQYTYSHNFKVVVVHILNEYIEFFVYKPNLKQKFTVDGNFAYHLSTFFDKLTVLFLRFDFA